MPGVPKDFAEHKLHVRPDAKPVKQPLRRLLEEKRRIVGEEIARVLAADFIMEVFYSDWLANPVRVPPDQAGSGRPLEDRLHHTIRRLLLHHYDVRFEECQRHLLALHAEVPPEATRLQCPRLCG